jgi:transcriptional regulator with XRE-family HTH domain
MSIKENIQKLIKGKTTQKKIEKDLGMAERTISSWEHHDPTLENLIAVAKYLNVSVDTLLGREDSLPDDPEEGLLIEYFRMVNQEHKQDLIKMAMNFYVIERMDSPVKKDSVM